MKRSVNAVRWPSASVADTLRNLPGVAARDVAISGRMPDVYRQFRVWLTVATALTNQPPYC